MKRLFICHRNPVDENDKKEEAAPAVKEEAAPKAKTARKKVVAPVAEVEAPAVEVEATKEEE